MAERLAVVHEVAEWGFLSAKGYGESSDRVEVDVVFRHAAGGEWRVPAYWAGEREWRIRFAPPAAGLYRWESCCSDAANGDLHGVTGALRAEPHTGANRLLARGPIRVARGGTHFEYADGTPFFWLGDTWWMGLCSRLAWPGDFQELVADRVAKGFNVIQIVAGLYPDMPAFDPRGRNEAGYPWEADFARIRPAYFDAADLRLRWLVRSGLVPCIVGCWGYYLPWLGIERMKRHWRTLVARYGAYPVVWCLAGEGSMPYYLSQTREADKAALEQGWAEIGRYLRSIDPWRRPVSIHPSTSARDTVADEGVLDFDMLQTG
ncbi:MAG: DUF4038 domain-containing protein, partial [Lentisphaeria bacterium]|nr:DUF4038 domain-containing protein [Lentisphaeria bacterium]